MLHGIALCLARPATNSVTAAGAVAPCSACLGGWVGGNLWDRYGLFGNMTTDGRYKHPWNGENRLLRVQSRSDTPEGSWRRVEWQYDGLGRRIRQTTWTWLVQSNQWVVTEDLKFLSDPLLFGRHLVDLNASNNVAVRTYVWGLDMSETMDGAGGVGGLLWMTLHTGSGPTAGTHFCAYDGNGNVVALASASDGSATGRYEYGPFGDPIRLSGPAATLNPFRFSTKRTDNSTDCVLYEYRVYSPSTGRWGRRDPIWEPGFELVSQRPKSRDEALVERVCSALDSLQAVDPKLITGIKKRLGRIGFDPWKSRESVNLYSFVNEDPVNHIDLLGLEDKKGKVNKKCQKCCEKQPNPAKELFKTAADTLSGAIAKADDWPSSKAKAAAQMVRILILASDAKDGCGAMEETAETCLEFARDPDQFGCNMCCNAIFCNFPKLGGFSYFVCHGICSKF